MERLTEYSKSTGEAQIIGVPNNRIAALWITEDEERRLFDGAAKLADYEDAEENGTLIRPKGFCCDCRKLRLCKNSNVYAECMKVGTIFAPFELDTRTHFCKYFTLAEEALKERESE